jgi:ribulose-5-phosphate 4-epimerase/fuculose-1-phosphate aldolase
MDSLNPSVPAFDSSELKELKQKLVDGCHILDREGITDGFGHVSVRIPGTEAFLTIAGVSPGCATLDRLVMLDFDGGYLGGVESPPYEWPIHACIMRARPEVMSAGSELVEGLRESFSNLLLQLLRLLDALSQRLVAVGSRKPDCPHWDQC